MVITTTGKNRIIELLKNDISSMEIGTDGTTATSSDTSLGSPLISTKHVPVINVSDKTLTLTHRVASTEGNGQIFRELGVFLNTDTILLDRVVFPDVSKNSGIEVTTIDILRIS